MDRRTFIATASIAPIAGVAMTGTSTHDPIIGFVKEWFRIRDDWTNFVEGSAEDKQAWDYREALGEKICNTMPTTPEGIVAQLEYALDDFSEYMVGNFHKDLDHKLFANVIAGAKSL